MSRLAWSSRVSCSSAGTSPTDGSAGGVAETGGRGAEMTQRGEATRARLIEATRSVVREVGYAHASTRAIAQAAGVAEGTIYRHFPDKAALFFATVLAANAPIVAWVTTLPARAGQGTVEAEPHRRCQPTRRHAGPDPSARARDRRRSGACGPASGRDGRRRFLAAARPAGGRGRVPRRRTAAGACPRRYRPARGGRRPARDSSSRSPACRESGTRIPARRASRPRCGSWSTGSCRRPRRPDGSATDRRPRSPTVAPLAIG